MVAADEGVNGAKRDHFLLSIDANFRLLVKHYNLGTYIVKHDYLATWIVKNYYLDAYIVKHDNLGTYMVKHEYLDSLTGILLFNVSSKDISQRKLFKQSVT